MVNCFLLAVKIKYLYSEIEYPLSPKVRYIIQ